MRCERCGRENPEHLTFCEDCGYNLKAARRDAGAAPASRATPSGSGPSLQRPQAPPLRLGERHEAPVTRTDQGPLCSVCQTRNQAGHRFCIACGSPLPVAAAPSVTAALAAEPAAPAAAAVPQAAPAIGAVAAPVAAPPIEAAPAAPMGPGHTARPAAPMMGMTPPASVTSTVLVPSAAVSAPLPPAPAPTASMSTAIPDEPPAPAPAPARANDAPTPLAVPSPLFRGHTVPLSPPGLETIDPSSIGVAAPLGAPASPPGSTTVVLDRSLTGEAEPPPRRPPSERTKKPTAPDGVAAMRMREQSDSLPPPNEPSLQALPLVSLAEPSVRPPEQQVCPRCRTVSEAGTPFCRVCGQSLSAGGAARGPEPAPPPTSASPVTAPQGSPRPVLEVVTPKVATLGRIVQLAKDGTDGPSHAILSETFDLGSREGEVTLDDDPYLSPRHARLLREGGHWYVVDLDSVNGVYRRVQGKRALSDGDLILLGQQVLRFEVVMDAEHALRPAVQHGVALFGTPQAPRLARLCQRTVEGVTRDVYHLSRPETSLGRETADIVFSDDPFLSRRHAVVSVDREAATFAIEDQGSSNGTFVAIRGRERLTGGEVLRVGLHLFRVELAGGERGMHS